MWLKCLPLHVAVGAAMISLSILPFHAQADQTSSPRTNPSSERGSAPSEPKPSEAPTPDSETMAATASKPPAPAPLSAPDRGALPTRHLSRGEQLAKTALSYRGVPYRWGGRSPQTGFDCSGLVQAVYAKWGIYLPRLGREQYQMGQWVKPDKLEPGDLVFFKNTYKRGLSHVGLYVGDGFFVHAPHTGTTVSLARLDSAYYKAHWAGARRIDLSKLPPPEEPEKIERVLLEDVPPEQDPPPPKTSR